MNYEVEKISELDVLSTADNNDILVIDDVSASDTKKITKQNLLKELNSSTTSLGTRMTTAEGDIDTLESDVGSIQQSLSGAISDIANGLYYKDGDTYTATSVILNGFMTTGNTAAQVTVTLPKMLDNISSITINSYSAIGRCNNAYIIGTATTYANITNNTTARISSPNTITLTYVASSSMGGTNNTAVSIIANLSLTFNEE